MPPWGQFCSRVPCAEKKHWCPDMSKNVQLRTCTVQPRKSGLRARESKRKVEKETGFKTPMPVQSFPKSDPMLTNDAPIVNDPDVVCVVMIKSMVLACRYKL